MRILIIEDNDDIRNAIRTYLEEEFFVVDAVATGEKGLSLARINEYDAIILDCLLPDKDGLEVCQELRREGSIVPILVVSALADTHNKIAMLNNGADDYLTKPFSLPELRARIAALLRRPPVMVPDIITVADLKIDTSKQKVFRGDTEVYLTRKEFTLLEYLARNADRAVSRSMIMEHVWNMDTDPFSNTIEAHIFNLRKKIKNNETLVIHTVPGRGYKLSASA